MKMTENRRRLSGSRGSDASGVMRAAPAVDARRSLHAVDHRRVAAPRPGTAIECKYLDPRKSPASCTATTPMIVPTKSIWLAVHRVFSDAGVHAGQSLGLKEVMQAWAQTGLRQRDLGNALDSLGRVGFVKLTMTAEGPRALLVDESFGLLHASGRDSGAVVSLNHLREARGMPSHLAGLTQERKDGRRSEDRQELARAA